MKCDAIALRSAAAVLAMLTSIPRLAADDPVPDALKALTLNGQVVTPDAVHRVDLEGPIYEVRLRNGDTFYSDAQGRHMIVGTLFDNAPGGLIDVTERNDRQDRLDQLNALADGATVVYPARGDGIGEIAVFTDPTCPFCERLHQDIDRLTAAGITVRYVPYPRGGSDSPAAGQWARVLCADDARQAMATAFGGGALNDMPTQHCQEAVIEGFWLGQRFGIQGTPTIVLPDGEMGEGYVPARQLIQAIKRARQ
ncbi:DsbC family protein [Pistricoccus aurantiacus]|nr:DsbC family protein [Pistricoccus aurantiacus]